MPAEILILGGGFAGLAAAEELASRGGSRRHRIRLIDRRRESVFAPLLPDLISGRVHPEHIAYPLESACRDLGIEYIHANIKEVYPGEGRVEAFEGSFKADYMIICLGCDTDYFGDDELKKHALGLKWVEEGVTTGARAKRMVDAAKSSGRPACFVVVGGGYTGIEAASHLAFLAKSRLGVPFDRMNEFARVIVVEKLDKILSMVPSPVREWAEDLVKGYHVEMRTGTTVERFDDKAVVLSDGTVIDDPLILWTAGVTPGKALDTVGAPRRNGGRLEVDDYLRLPGMPNAFAAGDVAAPQPRGQTHPLRMAVQFSLGGGRLAAANVRRAIERRPLKEFDPIDLGYLLPLAPGRAAGVILGHQTRGVMPFMLHYFMSVYRAYGYGNRLRIVGDLWKELMTSGER